MSKLLCSSLASLLVLAAVPAEAASLSAVCGDALKQDPAVASADHALFEAGERVGVARSNLFPKLSLSGEVATDRYQRDAGPLALFARSAGVHASELIYDGMGSWHHWASAEADRDAAKGDRLRHASDAALDVTRAYLAVIRERALAACADTYLAQHEAAVKRLEATVAADSGKAFDLLQVRTRAIYAASLVKERRSALRAAELLYREQVGAKPGSLDYPQLLAGKGFASLEEARQVADRDEPSIVTARARLGALQASREEAEAVMAPVFSLDSSYVVGQDIQGLPGRNDEGFVGVNASFALSTGGAPRATIDTAKAEEKAAEARVEGARRDVREAVAVAWDRRQGLIEKLPLAEEQLGWTRKVVDGFQQQFKAGRRTALDLLTVQDQAYQAETDAIAVRIDRVLADYELAYHEGQLSRWLPVSTHEATR